VSIILSNHMSLLRREGGTSDPELHFSSHAGAKRSCKKSPVTSVAFMASRSAAYDVS
jgi:hypothetical protein